MTDMASFHAIFYLISLRTSNASAASSPAFTAHCLALSSSASKERGWGKSLNPDLYSFKALIFGSLQ
jgi:hypothetical protein